MSVCLWIPFFSTPGTRTLGKAQKMKSLSRVRLFVTPRTIACSSVHGIFQVRLLEWVAISFSKGSSQPRDQTRVSCTAGSLFTIWATREIKATKTQLVQFSHSVMSDSLWPHESQHTRPPCPSSTPGVHSNSCPSSRWWHPAISSSLIPFSSCPQSLPASGYFQMCQLLAWGGQNIGVSASASVLPMNTQDWSPLGWTGWISLQSKGLSRVFSNTTVQKHQFVGAQLSSQSNSHIHTWLLENYSFDKMDLRRQSNVSAF